MLKFGGVWFSRGCRISRVSFSGGVREGLQGVLGLGSVQGNPAPPIVQETFDTVRYRAGDF